MKYSASVHNVDGKIDVVMKKGDEMNTVNIPPRHNGHGSSISGGEILFLAIAACYCNDIFREAKKVGMVVENVEVDVDGNFLAAGEPATNVKCEIKVTAQAGAEEIRKLIEHTDSIAEIPMSLRKGTPVRLATIEAISSQ